MYTWRFTQAYGSWAEGDVIDPPTCLSVSQTKSLIRNGILVRSDTPVKRKPKPAPVAETAEAVRPNLETTAEPVVPPRRGRGRPRREETPIGGTG